MTSHLLSNPTFEDRSVLMTSEKDWQWSLFVTWYSQLRSVPCHWQRGDVFKINQLQCCFPNILYLFYVSYHVASNVVFSAIHLYSQEFCDVGTAPPALILLLSRLCLDFQESTISYVVCAFLVVSLMTGYTVRWLAKAPSLHVGNPYEWQQPTSLTQCYLPIQLRVCAT